MENFNWKDNHSPRNWRQRYPEDVLARDQWRAFSRDFSEIGGLFEALKGVGFDWESRLPTHLSKPRIFISHRQADEKRALEIKQIVAEEGCEYWLDVIDPELENANGLPLPDSQKAIVIAAVIEMALLNCSHVLALVTANSFGSTWIPYEYGRVKVGRVWSQQSCCWIANDVKAEDYKNKATYLYLGEITKSDAEVRNWLQREKAKWPPKIPPTALRRRHSLGGLPRETWM